MSSSNSPRNRPVYHAFHVKDGYWTKIGAAWNTQSGKALSVVLDVLPLDGRLVLAHPKQGARTSSADSAEA